MNENATPLDVSEVRSWLTKYADSVPHHPFQQFGKVVNLKVVSSIPIFAVSLDTLYEDRELFKTEKPYSGWLIPQLRVNESNVNVWHYQFPLISEEFRAASCDYRIDDSQHVIGCHDCSSQGCVICISCGGHLKVTCRRCRGQTTIQCRVCNGAGNRVEHRPQTATVVSSDGEIYHALTSPQEVYHPCPQCAAQGRERCPNCDVRGLETCPECDGRGRLTCSRCDGTAKLVNTLHIRQLFNPKFEHRSVCDAENPQDIASGCPSDAVSMLTEGDYHTVISETVEQFNVGQLGFIHSAALRKNVAEMISKAGMDEKRRPRISLQSLTVRKSEICLVDYEYRASIYQCWIVCDKSVNQHESKVRIFAPHSPITEAVDEIVRSAVVLWNKGNRFDAAEAFAPALDMAHADPNCRSLVDRHEIPSGLETFGGLQTWTRRIGGNLVAICYLTAAVVLVCLLIAILVKGCSREENGERSFLKTRRFSSQSQPAKLINQLRSIS